MKNDQIINIENVLKAKNMFEKHGFKLFGIVGIINMLMQSFTDILKTFPNIVLITIIAIHLVKINQQLYIQQENISINKQEKYIIY